MTATTARGSDLWSGPVPRRTSPTLRTARTLVTWFAQIAVWYWAFVVLVVVSVPLGMRAFGVDPSLSILWFARQSGVWFPFSVLIGMALAYPQVHVANGMTRRSYAAGALAATTTVALAFALLMSLAMQVERIWYEAMGWGWGTEEQGWFEPGTGFGDLLVAYVATFLVAYLSGLLVGTVYAGAGGWWGTLTLPLTVGPIILVTAIIDSRTGWLPFPDVPPAVLLVAVTLVLAVALGAAFWLLATRRAIAPRRG